MTDPVLIARPSVDGEEFSLDFNRIQRTYSKETNQDDEEDEESEDNWILRKCSHTKCVQKFCSDDMTFYVEK